MHFSYRFMKRRNWKKRKVSYGKINIWKNFKSKFFWENHLITNKEITEKLLKLNYIISKESPINNGNNNMIINEMVINSEQISKIINTKNIDSKHFEHSYAYYKKNYLSILYERILCITRE